MSKPSMAGDAEALKLCPFCGARDEQLVQAFTRVTDDFAYWSVECLGCACEIASDASQAEAVAAWNTRATSEHPAPVGSESVQIETLARLTQAADRKIGFTRYRPDDRVMVSRADLAAAVAALSTPSGPIAGEREVLERENARLRSAIQQRLDALRTGTLEDEGAADDLLRAILATTSRGEEA